MSAGSVIDGPIWAVGAGNMGGAMLRRWLDTGLDPARLTVIRKSGAAFADGVETLSALPVAGAGPALVLLGMGRAWRSTLPLALMGSLPSDTKQVGTM